MVKQLKDHVEQLEQDCADKARDVLELNSQLADANVSIKAGQRERVEIERKLSD